MYSGSTLTPLKLFDAWFGAHQKIDRIARRNLLLLLRSQGYPGTTYVPQIRFLAKFEGQNGPDGIKRKSPGQAEPWHYIDPYDESDDRLLKIISEHMALMKSALEQDNDVRAAFEAAWLAHAVVDGLTPAHHYPFENELMKLRGGQGIETRNSIKEKLVVHGDTIPKRLRNNWKMWGEKGLLSSHIAFEMGVATIIAPLRFRAAKPSQADLEYVRTHGFLAFYVRQARTIADLDLYNRFVKSAWTPRLAKAVRRELMPIIINTVTLAWYSVYDGVNA